MAGYLKALGDSTSDATAIDLDVGVSSQPADEDSVFRVQESADGTSLCWNSAWTLMTQVRSQLSVIIGIQGCVEC